MTPTSEERREVAERLRTTKAECDERSYPWMVEDLLQALGFETYEDGDDGIFDRLADLIDPCPSMADEQMDKLRRRSTALASMTRIASDMSGWAGELADSCERMSRARIADDVKRFADRIRQEARDALN